MSAASETDTALPIGIQMRPYFSGYHLWAARHAAWRATSIEANHSGGSRFDIQHRAHVMNAIVGAAAFVEASINELLQDAADNYGARVAALDPRAREILAMLWDMTGQGKTGFNVLEKYDLALGVLGQQLLAKGDRVFQDAKLVIEIRNFLMHFKPSNVSELDPHRLAAKLARKFPLNPLMAGAGNPQFPDHMLGAGCANWACTSVLALTDDFTTRTGMQFHYQQVDFGPVEVP